MSGIMGCGSPVHRHCICAFRNVVGKSPLLFVLAAHCLYFSSCFWKQKLLSQWQDKIFLLQKKALVEEKHFRHFLFTAKEKRDFWDLPHEYFMNYLRKSLRDEWLKIGDSVVWWTNCIPAIVPMAAIFNYCDIANMGR